MNVNHHLTSRERVMRRRAAEAKRLGEHVVLDPDDVLAAFDRLARLTRSARRPKK